MLTKDDDGRGVSINNTWEIVGVKRYIFVLRNLTSEAM